LNQAAFAIDDFFSATGGLEQKLRAVSNNVTQLAFIVGGTEGLFIGLAAVIGGQALLALTKWANGGRTAEDQTKALNDALARQKSIVDELAQSFRNLGSSIADRAFAESTKSAREFEERLKEVVKQIREVRDAQLGDINPDVQRERAQQNALEERLKGEQNIGRRVAIQNEINAARQREREAVVRAAAAGAPDQRDVRGALRRTVFVTSSRFSGGARGPSPANRRRFAEIDADLAAAGNNREELLEILRRAQIEQGAIAQQGEFRQARSRQAQDNVRVLQEVITRLENAGDIARVVEQGFRLAEQASNTLAQAQQKAADALEAGAPGAEDAFASLEQLAGGLRASLDAISKAQEDFSNRNIAAEERDNIIRRAFEAINAGGQRRQQAADRADALDRERLVSPERLFEARLNRSRDTLRESGFGQGLFGRQLSGLEISRQQVLGRLSQNPNDKAARQQLEVINKQIVAIESASLALSRFGESLNRAAQEAESNLGAARQAANEARQESLLRDTPRNRERLDQANLDLAAQEQAKLRVDAEVQAARIRIEAEAQAGGLLRNEFIRIRDIQEQIAAGSQDQNIIRELSSLLQGVNRQVQEDPRVRAAADASSQTEQDRQARLRGMRVGMTPGQQLGNELQEGLDEIQRAFGDQLKKAANLREMAESMADTGRQLAAGDAQIKRGVFPEQGLLAQQDLFSLQGGLAGAVGQERKRIEDQIAEAERRIQRARDFAGRAGERLAEADELDVAKQFRDERLRQAAPQVFALQDAVQNSILQGPSRAALNAADVTTMEGSRELNRLLRGDDPARDVNLLELQKQTALLEEANRIAKDGPRVAN
jgi:exonuclease VII small subunit